jgi:hypothetical protein
MRRPTPAEDPTKGVPGTGARCPCRECDFRPIEPEAALFYRRQGTGHAPDDRSERDVRRIDEVEGSDEWATRRRDHDDGGRGGARIHALGRLLRAEPISPSGDGIRNPMGSSVPPARCHPTGLHPFVPAIPPRGRRRWRASPRACRACRRSRLHPRPRTAGRGGAEALATLRTRTRPPERVDAVERRSRCS